MVCCKSTVNSVFSRRAWKRRDKRVISQNAAEKIPSHASCYLSRALLLASSFFSPKLNLSMTTVKVQGHLCPSTHSFNPWSLPSALPASRGHSFAAMSNPSGSDWSHSAVCDPVGTCPRRMVPFTMILFPATFGLFSLQLCYLFHISVKGEDENRSALPLLHIFTFTYRLFCMWSAWNLYLDQLARYNGNLYHTGSVCRACSCTSVVTKLHMKH